MWYRVTHTLTHSIEHKSFHFLIPEKAQTVFEIRSYCRNSDFEIPAVDFPFYRRRRRQRRRQRQRQRQREQHRPQQQRQRPNQLQLSQQQQLTQQTRHQQSRTWSEISEEREYWYSVGFAEYLEENITPVLEEYDREKWIQKQDGNKNK